MRANATLPPPVVAWPPPPEALRILTVLAAQPRAYVRAVAFTSGPVLVRGFRAVCALVVRLFATFVPWSRASRPALAAVGARGPPAEVLS